MTDIHDRSSGSASDAESARIAKVIARAGLASRRDAEAMVEEGRVTVNGRAITSPATNVGPNDRITVDGQPLPARERTRLWLYHKPRGLVTTAKDPEGRPTVFEVLPPELPRVVSVGRLDLNTEGLLLLTNDGGLARVLSHPDTAWLRRYRVRAFGDITPDRLESLRKGIEIDGFAYGPIEAEIDRRTGDNIWLTLGLREGKNREVRRVLEHLGLVVNRLIRVSFGPFQLADMLEGSVEEIRTRYLRDQIGGLAEEANCDFTAPVIERGASGGAGTAPKKARARSGEPPANVRRSAGLTKDRKGRRVLVERVEVEKPARPARARPDHAPEGDRRGRGPDERPRFRTGDASARGPRPRHGEERREERGPRPDAGGSRPFRARPDTEGRGRPRDERGEGGFDRNRSRPEPRRDGGRRDEGNAGRPERAASPFRSSGDRPTRAPAERGRGDGREPRSGAAGAPRGRTDEHRSERPRASRPDAGAPRPFRARPDTEGRGRPHDERGESGFNGNRTRPEPRRDGGRRDEGKAGRPERAAKPFRSSGDRSDRPARAPTEGGPGEGRRPRFDAAGAPHGRTDERRSERPRAPREGEPTRGERPGRPPAGPRRGPGDDRAGRSGPGAKPGRPGPAGRPGGGGRPGGKPRGPR
jgi:23S rRNA pseudouridine2605 synthase